MFRNSVFVATVVILSGCTTTRIINPNKPAELSRISLAQNHKTVVTLIDGRRFAVSQYQIKPDSTRWFDGKKFVAVATADIKAITQIQRGKGALQGLVVGFWVGAIAGGIIAYSTYEPELYFCQESDDPGKLLTCIGGGAAIDGAVNVPILMIRLIAGTGLGSMAGGIGGALIGNAVGSKAEYQFRASKPILQCNLSGCQSKILYLCNECHKGWCGDHEKAGNPCRECRKGLLTK